MATKGEPRKPRWDAGMTRQERQAFKRQGASQDSIASGGCRGITGSGRCGKPFVGKVPYCPDCLKRQ